jgi:DNA-binding NtrC family response regulator
MNDHPGEYGKEIGELGKLFQRVRSRLKEGGPEVEYAALYAYIDRNLRPEDQQRVERRISTWRSWHDAYWELRADLEEDSGEGQSESEAPRPEGHDPLEHNREVVERNVIQRALASHGYSRANAARALGISRVTLYKKMRKYGLMRSPLRPGDAGPSKVEGDTLPDPAER